MKSIKKARCTISNCLQCTTENSHYCGNRVLTAKGIMNFLAFKLIFVSRTYMNQFTPQDCFLCGNPLVDVSIVIQSWQHIKIHMHSIRKKYGEGKLIPLLFLEHSQLSCWAKTFTLMWLTYTLAHTYPQFRIWADGFVFHYFLLNPRWGKYTFQKSRKASISVDFPNSTPKLL